ncbi:MAG: hypothetical protein CM1200mP22_04820 [Dehalococcoidia bacterium]|nr:MAG: hypothetical protein CM1200mP22_04820 [Dehalococcoidia bacterium]
MDKREGNVYLVSYFRYASAVFNLHYHRFKINPGVGFLGRAIAKLITVLVSDVPIPKINFYIVQ